MTLEDFLNEGPRFLKFDSGTVELRLADDSEPDRDGVTLLRSLASGHLLAMKIIQTGTSE